MCRKNNFLRSILALVAISQVLGASGLAERSQKPALETSVQLQALVREVLDRNPEVQAARRTLEAKRARIPQARAWPDPRVTVSYAGNFLPPFTLMSGDPSSMRQFSAEQGIPYPGKTRLRSEIAARDEEAETFNYESIQRRIVAEVKQAYFDLYFTDRSLSTLHKNSVLLEKFEKVAEIRYSVGQTAQQDVLKAQVELSKLREREALLEQSRRTLEAELNSLRDFPVDKPVAATGEFGPSPFTHTIDELVEAARANNSSLKRQRTIIDQNSLSVALARKEVRPDFSLGYIFSQRAGTGDMYGITFSTSLPLFRHSKQDQAIREAAANLESTRHMEANEFAVVRYQVKQGFLQVQAADQLLKLYSQGIVPQSSLALESSLSTYETGKTDFLTVLSNYTTVVDYELAYQQQLVNRQKALARLEELTGLTLIP